MMLRTSCCSSGSRWRVADAVPHQPLAYEVCSVCGQAPPPPASCAHLSPTSRGDLGVSHAPKPVTSKNACHIAGGTGDPGVTP
jgi:hypothetical protein